jgi:hypothetical protein
MSKKWLLHISYLFRIKKLPVFDEILITDGFGKNVSGVWSDNAENSGFIRHVLDGDVPLALASNLDGNTVQTRLGAIQVRRDTFWHFSDPPSPV